MTDIIQRSFAGGEIAPAFWAKADLNKYATGLRTCRNFIIKKEGGARNRAGTEFCEEVSDPVYSTANLIPFIYSNSQAYALEFRYSVSKGGTVRFYQGGALVMVLRADAPDFVAYTNYIPGNLVYWVADTSFWVCIKTTGTAFSDPTDVTYWFQLVALTDVDVGVKAPMELPTPYNASQIFDLGYTQSADVLTLTHPSHDPRELRRYGNTNWELFTIVWGAQYCHPLAR